MPYINKPKKKDLVTYKHSYEEGNKYYNSKYWKKLRNQYIMLHPLCELCALEGKSVPAEEVHHIKFINSGTTDEEKWDLLLDPNNIMSLCEKCHHKVHNYAHKRNILECNHY